MHGHRAAPSFPCGPLFRSLQGAVVQPLRPGPNYATAERGSVALEWRARHAEKEQVAEDSPTDQQRLQSRQFRSSVAWPVLKHECHGPHSQFQPLQDFVGVAAGSADGDEQGIEPN